MKKIKFALLCALCTLAMVSCETVMWESDDLVETEVWTMSYNSSSVVWYFYPEYSFYITEDGLSLEIIQMSDWKLNQEDDKITVTLKSEMPEANEYEANSMQFSITFDSSTSEGVISTQYYTNSTEDSSLSQEEYISGLDLSMKLIESRE